MYIPANADIYKYKTEDGTVVYTDTPLGKNASLILKSRKSPADAFNGKYRKLYKNIRKYYPIVKKRAKEYSVDPDLIRAMITVESNWFPMAVSSKGAMGLMQLMPRTAKALEVNNPFDPDENIDGGIKYFRMLLDLFKGNLRYALAAYNSGPTRVRSDSYFPEGSETRRYVVKVLSIYGGEDKFEYIPLRRDLHPKPIYRLVLEDGTLLFTDTPHLSGGTNF